MRLLAALGSGVFVYLLVGLVFGVRPRSVRGSRNGSRRPMAAWQDWLHQADAPVTVGQLVLATAAMGAIASVAVQLTTGVAPLALLAGLMGSLAPLRMLARRRAMMLNARLAAWPDALRDLVTHLRASHSLHAGICELGQSGPPPLRPFFARYATLAGALDQRAALEVVREDLADPLSDRIIEILLVAFEQGPTVIVDILDDLARASSDDLRLAEEIETAQLETRIEARGATVLPFVVLALLCATSNDYRAFYQTMSGWLVVALGAGLALLGLLVISRLGSLPVEERTLAGGQ